MKSHDQHDQYEGVWIFIEHQNDRIKKVSLELLAKGRELADVLQVDLSALLLGNQLDKLPQSLISYGADIVYVVENKLFKRYLTDPYRKICHDLIHRYKPETVLFSSTDVGMDLAPSLARDLRTGLSAHCVDLKIDNHRKGLLQICPYADYMATIVTDTRPQMATVQPGIASVPEKDNGRDGKIIKIDAHVERGNVKIVRAHEKEKDSAIDLSDADVIIAVGRGMKNIKLAEELADALKGVIGATQAVTDAGLLPESMMIGQTGKFVQPRLYIACGISGAGQHVVGMQTSGTIVAINKNKRAPIFKIADYGIIGDTEKVIPELILRLAK